MADSNGRQIFFLDDDLIERLMRGDAAADPKKPRREAQSNALAKAIELASEGRVDAAIREREEAAQRGETSGDL